MDYLRRSAVFTNCLYVVSAIVLAVYNTKVHAHITVIEYLKYTCENLRVTIGESRELYKPDARFYSL